MFQLQTPGGGGWGPASQEKQPNPIKATAFVERGSVFEYKKAQESV